VQTDYNTGQYKSVDGRSISFISPEPTGLPFSPALLFDFA